jgi:hypothetical protein
MMERHVPAQPLLDRWLRIAEAQLDAARRLDGATLAALTDERRQVQACLDTDTISSWSDDERGRAREFARQVRAIDVRTRAVGNSVVASLTAALPSAGPATYSRRGRVQGT